ncbi:MAG TPA: phytanoyl-CoA dioxygenase family protein [Stellaceae bacterium]|nr:phytanoyl-CoA dioxygenase family protein [Stellaceae bacterium]
MCSRAATPSPRRPTPRCRTPERSATLIDPYALQAALAHYRSQGYAVLPAVFNPAEIAAMAAGFDRHWSMGLSYRTSFRHSNLFYRLGTDPKLGKIVRLVQWPCDGDPVLEQFRRDPRLLEILAPVLGRDIKQVVNQLHWKPPGAVEAEFAFHQDVRFRRPRECYRNLAVSYVQTGIAIDRHTRENGCMRVLPGSHLRGELAMPVPAQVQGASPDEAALRTAGLDPARLLDVPLQPGDVAIWSVFLVHGSGPNTTPGDRRFYINGYVRAADCDRGEWTFKDGQPVGINIPSLVHYEDLTDHPEPHYVEE